MIAETELAWRTTWDAHLEQCWQCRTHPFGMCPVGVWLILEFPALSSAEETETKLQPKETE